MARPSVLKGARLPTIVADARRDLVGLFEDHGALLDPDLLDHLVADSDGLARAQLVLASLGEVPFHFDKALWEDLERKEREAAAPDPVPAPADESAKARKEALKQALGKIYDAGPAADADEEDDVVDDHDEDLNPTDDKPRAGQEAAAFTLKRRSEWRPSAAGHEARLEIVNDMTGNSTCDGATSDFVDYFQDRYEQIAKMLRQRRDLRNAVPVEAIRPGQQEVSVIAMVESTATTKNGHRRIELEDPSGTITALVRADEKALTAFADSLVSDEVVGVVGQASGKGDLLFVTDIIRPDIPRRHPDEMNHADAPVSAAFLSDIHVGSNTFLPENWARMIGWLNGDAATRRERDAAGRIKYLVIPGDLVDGIGIYPGQNEELTIGDIYDQYREFGRWMQNIPDHVEVVVQPGNHDAARPAEPQPAFSEEVREAFDHHGTHFVANPAWFKMHDVLTLGYHGFSLIDFATTVTNLDYEDPLPTMEQMLQCRHMAPLYGERTPVAPEHHDHLVISEVPDLFVTGHVHVPGIRKYRGVTNINCGTWQAQTLYQKMLNFTPDPAKMPLVDL